MNKETLWTEIVSLCQKLNLNKEPKLSAKVFSETKFQTFQHCLNWLKNFEKGPYLIYKEAYALVAPEMWEYYLCMGETSLPEQVILRDARTQMMETWKNRPSLLKKVKHESKNTQKHP